MKNKRSLWVSLLSVVAIAVIALGATLAAGWSPKLGLDLDGGLSVVYQTHTPVNQAQLDTIVTILNDRVSAGTSGATVDSQGRTRSRCAHPRREEHPADPGHAGQHRPALLPAGALLRAAVHGGQGEGSRRPVRCPPARRRPS